MVKVTAKHASGDRVLCYHGAMLYDSKILEVVIDEGVAKYFVHYQGWNNRWDEWVEDDRVLQFNDDNVKKQEELITKHGGTAGGKGGAGGGHRGRPSLADAATPKATKANAAGGKAKTSTGSSGPSTPFDGSKTAASASSLDGPGGGLELESRASTPSVDGGASVASSVAQSGSVKRKAGGKQKGAGAAALDTKQDEVQETPTNSEPKRKRGRQSAASLAQQLPSVGVVAAATPTSGMPPEFSVESFDQFRGRHEVLVKIPEDLKEVLVDDWDLVTRQNKLCKVPATKSVDDILNEYIKYKQQQKGIGGQRLDQAKETVNGLSEYFNVMCGTQLLYKFERPQYKDVLGRYQQQDDKEGPSPVSSKGEVRLSSVYGFAHLLRLFVRIGHMLAYTDLDPKTVEQIVTWLHELLKYLAKNKPSLFHTDDYETAPPDYQRTAYVN